ncbi:Uma2 family endonuclease [Nocardia sp. CDC160]|uniref:Uma2 family endonuclease n=1 Tax=Nocardia sp. CDC160 TaxID=3112166 RepID=UPI002DB7EE18|nr:Uma2 family endonuclease [Nocardia sp. CDC160]MEC3916948.1 Uma2 family endonuclease [Nocardia sp. CDC160]
MNATLPEWMYPPRPSGWEADDLDLVPDLPRHTELIDGALIFMVSPQRSWHGSVIRRLATALEDQAPAGQSVGTRMSVKLDRRSRPEPDVIVGTVLYDPERTCFLADQVSLVVEVVSDESLERDRQIKPFKYAGAGIRHFWRIEDEDLMPVVHSYELDEVTKTYVPTGIHRNKLTSSVPFPIEIDLGKLSR